MRKAIDVVREFSKSAQIEDPLTRIHNVPPHQHESARTIIRDSVMSPITANNFTIKPVVGGRAGVKSAGEVHGAKTPGW